MSERERERERENDMQHRLDLNPGTLLQHSLCTWDTRSTNYNKNSIKMKYCSSAKMPWSTYLVLQTKENMMFHVMI